MVPDFEISADTRALANRLTQVPFGETITYAQLSEVIGRDIRTCRHLLHTAFNVVMREAGALYSVNRSVGYVRVAAERCAEIGRSSRAKIRRTARRGRKGMTALLAKANDVPNAVRLDVNKELGTLGLMEHLSRDSSVSALAEQEQPMPVAKVAKMALAAMGVEKT